MPHSTFSRAKWIVTLGQPLSMSRTALARSIPAADWVMWTIFVSSRFASVAIAQVAHRCRSTVARDSPASSDGGHLFSLP